MQYYNLDMVISIGYKVNTDRTIQFRRWATNVLKTFTIQGYVLDKERQQLVAKLPWGHALLLIKKIKDKDIRKIYVENTIKNE